MCSLLLLSATVLAITEDEGHWLRASLNVFQGIVLDILVALGVIKSHHFWLDVEHVEEALQNALVCVEMVFFAAFQRYAYSAKPYRDESSATSDKKKEWI